MPETDKEQRQIVVDETKCQCCWICSMRCGLRFAKYVDPEAARIKVNPCYERWPEISFAEDCDQCGICVRHCPSGALVFEEDAVEQEGGMRP